MGQWDIHQYYFDFFLLALSPYNFLKVTSFLHNIWTMRLQGEWVGVGWELQGINLDLGAVQHFLSLLITWPVIIIRRIFLTIKIIQRAANCELQKT